MKTQFEEFFAAYIACALWSSTDDDGIPLDENFTPDNIAPDDLGKLKADAEKFYRENEDDILTGLARKTGCADHEYAGHDLWLTQNGHGCGFWDGDWREPQASRLTAAADRTGNRELYLGDDGKLYLYFGC